jgi:small subunit ribosomal protein S18
MAKNKYNKPCQFCIEKTAYIDYKNIRLLRKFISKYAKIIPRYYTGVCLTHQKSLANAIKNARFVALLSFVR